jgi:integrase
MRRPPQLRLHATGQFFVRFGGKNHYLGKDSQAAQRQYPELLRAWSAWRSARGRVLEQVRPGSMTVAEAAEAWLLARAAEASPKLLRGYRADLRPIVSAAGALPMAALDAAKLIAISADLRVAGRSPSTINHTIRAAKMMIQWAMDTHPSACPPINLRPLRLQRERKRADLAAPPAQVARYIAAAEALDPRLGPWLRLGFLTGARVGELVRLVHGLGRWHRPDRGAFVFATSNKTAHSTGEGDRFIVLTEEAIEQLRLCGRHWSTPNGFSHAWSDRFGDQPAPAGGGEPPPGIDQASPDLPQRPVKFLRHSAYQGLLDAGVEFNRARILMGHAVPGSWGHYAAAPWHAWRADMAKLTLHGLPPSATGASGRSVPIAPPGAAGARSRRRRGPASGRSPRAEPGA